MYGCSVLSLLDFLLITQLVDDVSKVRRNSRCSINLLRREGRFPKIRSGWRGGGGMGSVFWSNFFARNNFAGGFEHCSNALLTFSFRKYAKRSARG